MLSSSQRILVNKVLIVDDIHSHPFKVDYVPVSFCLSLTGFIMFKILVILLFRIFTLFLLLLMFS